MKLIAEGAEASVYSGRGRIVKRRHRKGYRIKELDDKLRLHRTRREAKILERLKEKISVPNVIAVDEKETTLQMELVKGKKLKDALGSSNWRELGSMIGRMAAEMHDSNIIHGDLTTSNMILKNGKIYFVDFGLGFFSEKIEDKAVDLHLLKQALNSSHSEISAKCFETALKEYKANSGNSGETVKRLEKVEGRGRYKGKK